MGEFDGVYRHKHSQELVVVKQKDATDNSYLSLPLYLFESATTTGGLPRGYMWMRLSLSSLSENYIRTTAEEKIEALYHVKERLNEGNSI